MLDDDCSEVLRQSSLMLDRWPIQSAEASGPDESLQMIPIELGNNGRAARLGMAIGYVRRGRCNQARLLEA